MSLAVEKILSIIDRDGEEELALDLSSFSCGAYDEIQTKMTIRTILFLFRSIIVLIKNISGHSILKWELYKRESGFRHV